MKTFGISNTSYWGDLVEDVAAGDTLYLSDLVLELDKMGFRIYWMQDMLDQKPVVFKGMKAAEREKAFSKLVLADINNLPELDYLFVQWRWKMPGRNWYKNGEAVPPPMNDYIRQTQLLEHYSKTKTKIFILDADYKLTEDEEKQFPNVTLLEVSKTPKKQAFERKSIFWPFNFSELKKQIHKVHDPFKFEEVNNYPVDPNFIVSYIGNDYERDYQFNKYIVGASENGFEGAVHVYGNWLKYPEKIKKCEEERPAVVFHPKVTREAMEYIYSKSLCVPLLSKDEYATHGMMACRIFEVMYNGSIPVGFSEFKGVENYVLPELVVGTIIEFVFLLQKLMRQTKEERLDLWTRQVEHFNYSAKEFLHDIGIN